MQQEGFLPAVNELKTQGKSIRAIAEELGVNRGRVDRALKKLALSATEKLVTQADTSHAGVGTGHDVFVGRRHEMTVLTTALADAVSGRGRIVMLSGEPGIGKTRLAQEIGIVAADNNAQTLWGRCYEGQGAPSYWPWVQIIREYTRERDAEQLRSEMGAGAADIAEIVANVKAKLPGLEAPTSLDSPDANRFRLFDSIASFFKNAAQSKSVILVVEDLHWADKPSLLLLEFMAHEISGSRLLIVGTLRHTDSEHALSQTIGELAREPYFQQIHLPRLELSDVGRYIQETSGVRPPDEYTDAIYGRTDGNPFFMTELVRLHGNDPSATVEGEGFSDEISMPDSVRGAVRRRLEGLSETCNQVLTIASVMGREFGIDVLNILMSDVSSSQVLVELEEATRLRIVDEVAGEVGRYQFSHVLIQEAISDELSRSRKAALHAEIGEVLEGLYADNLEVHADELAHHFAEAVPITGIDKVVRYSLIAGERALATYAWEDALGHFERGLAAKEGQVMDAEKAALLFGLGRAQAATLERFQQHEAVTTVIPAFEYYVAVEDVPRALAIAEYQFRSLEVRSGATLYLTEALKLVPSDSHEAGRLLARFGAALNQELGSFESVVDVLSQAIVIAQREQDTALEITALANLANAHWMMRLDFQKTLEYGLRAIELNLCANNHQPHHDAHWSATMALMALGDLEGAWSHAAAHLVMAEKGGVRYRIAQALHANETLAHLQGDWKTARDFSDRGLAVGHRDGRLVSNRATLEYELGDFDQGDAYLQRLIETMRLSPPGPSLDYSIVPMAIGVAARLTGIPSQFDIAEAAADTALSSPHAVGMLTQLARTGLALMAVERGDAVAAREQYDALKPLRITMTPLNHVCGHRVLGLLAQTMGSMDDAVAHFDDSLAYCRKAGARPELAWTSYDCADVLLRRHESADNSRAMSLLDEALAISAELGMRPLTERIFALKEEAESKGLKSNAPTYPAGLTPREMEVLLLMAQGKTTREIASVLVLSPRTVQRHTTNLYAKINVRNRAEATAFALNGLTTST